MLGLGMCNVHARSDIRRSFSLHISVLIHVGRTRDEYLLSENLSHSSAARSSLRMFTDGYELDNIANSSSCGVPAMSVDIYVP